MWKSLGTKLKSVAEKKLAEHLEALAKREPNETEVLPGRPSKMTFGEALEQYRLNFQRDGELADNTKAFHEAGVKLVRKTWPK